MKRYQVIDYYDNPFRGDLVGEFDTRAQAERFAKQYSIKDCDGECDVEIREVEVISNE